MMLRDLVAKNRSYRRFDASFKVPEETLKELVEMALLTASGGNQQPLKYIVSSDKEKNSKIFDCLAWAAALKDWDGPDSSQRPSGYIIILNDTQIMRQSGCDHGIAAQTILLGAVEKGLGGCILGAVNREKLRNALDLPGRYDILLVLAIGKPDETVIIEPMPADGETRYWRDELGNHHVPKRSIDEVIIE
ncbi:MAG: nitroreductase family protein [Candidatus Sumerlaeota bacterium]